MEQSIKTGDHIQFYTCCNADRKLFTGQVEHIEQLGFVCVVDGVQYELRKLVDIVVLPDRRNP